MTGVASRRGFFQTVAHEFPMGGAALHPGLGLSWPFLAFSSCHFPTQSFIFCCCGISGLEGAACANLISDPATAGGARAITRPAASAAARTRFNIGDPPLSSYRSRVERHAGTPNTIGPTKISYPPARASTGPVDRAIESSVGRGLAEGT